MYLIALCDDEAAEMDKTEKMLGSYGKDHPGSNFLVERFESAEELLRAIREEKYMPDLVFMDIYMPDQKRTAVFREKSTPSGMEAARELRDMEYGGKLVFLTTSREYALDAFAVDASQYLVKPVSKDKLFPVLDRFLRDIEEGRKKHILLRIEGKLVRVALNDIIYCEAQGKTQCLHLAGGRQCLLRMTMMEVYRLLSHYKEFIRIGVAYIVNLEYIGSLNAKEILMDNGRKIYLPRGAYKSVKEQYFRYYCEEE